MMIFPQPQSLELHEGAYQLPAALAETLGGDFFTVHRLDRNVGGVMVYARTKYAAAALSRAIQENTMVKA